MDAQALPQVDTGLRALMPLARLHQIPSEECLVQLQFDMPAELLNAGQVLISFYTNLGQTQKSYRDFVSVGLYQSSPCGELINRKYLGSDVSINEAWSQIEPNRSVDSTSRLLKSQAKKPLKFSQQRYAKEKAIVKPDLGNYCTL